MNVDSLVGPIREPMSREPAEGRQEPGAAGTFGGTGLVMADGHVKAVRVEAKREATTAKVARIQ